MADNFFDYMFAANKQPEKTAEDSAPKVAEAPKKEQSEETVAMDEAIGEWTHKFTVYCQNPKAEFEEELKSKDGVVAVFAKAKESVPAPAKEPVSAENTPPNA